MSHRNKPEVVFLRVTDNQTKLRRITTTAQIHFEKGERVLIMVPNEKAGAFIDDLLWSTPKESFLPHLQTSESCNEKIAITVGDDNLNKAAVVINLCQGPVKKLEQFERIYELYDQTEGVKEQQSRQKASEYKTLGCVLI